MYINCCGGGDVQYDDCASHPETEQEVVPYRKAQQERQQQQKYINSTILFPKLQISTTSE